MNLKDMEIVLEVWCVITPSKQTKILADDTNGLEFYTGASSANERMVIDKDGKVGIGTDSPTAKLEIATAVGTTPFLRLLPNDTTTNPSGLTSIFLGTSTNTNYGISLSSWRKDSNGSPYFAINTHENSSSGETRFLVDKNGKVGINTMNPSYLLDVYGTGGGIQSCLCRYGGDQNFRLVAHGDRQQTRRTE